MIFRIYDQNNAANINTDGWSAMTTPLSADQINTIQDPTGGLPSREITSIPSPWGRLDLVRTAFRNVVASKRVEGDTLDHKLVSDTLDVAQICFHLTRLSKQGIVRTMRWGRQSELEALAGSFHQGHRELERAWSKYLSQDAESFNFDAFDECAVFSFVDPQTKAQMIIGGVSPVTLFFPAAGDLSKASAYIEFGLDKPFDGEYCPLTKREDAFVEWLYAMRKYSPSFSTRFPEVFAYLQMCQPQLTNAQQATINQLSSSTYMTNYQAQEYAPGQPIHILSDLPIYSSTGNNAGRVSQQSDFVISATKSIAGLAPLVLPTTPGFATLHYTVASWNPSTVVPEHDPKPLEQRILPADGSPYPYLTLGDFLEDKLVRLENTINAEHFYPGELESTITQTAMGQRGYLLPLKPLFFDYFSAKDLINGKMLSFSAAGTSITVTLSVPVKKGKITYTRTYQEPMEGAFGLATPTHTIESIDFELGMIHTRVYTPLCYILPTQKSSVVLKALSPQRSDWYPVTDEQRQDDAGQAIYTAALDGELEVLHVALGDCGAVLVPRPLRPVVATRSIEYAVDLGTSNTSIAYRRDGAIKPELLSWSEGDMVSTLTSFNNLALSRMVLYSRLALPAVGSGLHRFPLRTALRRDKANVSFKGAMLNMTPSLNYQFQDYPPAGSEMLTNIKWSSSNANDHSLRAYIYGLCVWLRKHAENLEVGAGVRLSWLFPSSMPLGLRKKLHDEWRDASQKFFGTAVGVSRVNEAVAPYFHLKSTAGVVGRTISMDIGGGTVDVLITGHSQSEPMHLTSSRLGANTLYAAPVNRQGTGSGFAQMLMDYLEQNKGGDNADGDLDNTLFKMKEFVAAGKSEEAVDRFFALAKMFEQKKHQALEMRLGRIMSVEGSWANRLRSLVLLYFSLQVYHVAEYMHIGGLDTPYGFVFSGNGSRILEALGDDEFLGHLLTTIFGLVAEQHGCSRQVEPIRAMFNPEPKESTAYGALDAGAQKAEPAPGILIVGGKFVSGREESEYHEKDLEGLYRDVDNFVKLFSSLDKQLRLVKDWGYDVDSLKKVAELLGNKRENTVTIDSYVKPEFTNDSTYSQGLIFSLMSHRIREIGLALSK